MSGPQFLAREDLTALLDLLRGGGRRLVGPQVRDGAIVYGPLEGVEALPWGVRDDQSPGRYRLDEGEKSRCFAWANGPQALKPLLFTPRETLWRSVLEDDGPAFEPVSPDAPALAVFGVRACDLAALRIHDQHFLEGLRPDPYYSTRRAGLFLVAVNCTHPAETCFCASTGDGPQVTEGHDLLLHELNAGYLLEAGSEEGAAVLARLPVRPADGEEVKRAGADVTEAVRAQERRLPSRNLNAALFERLDDARWAEVAERCLACGNCTQVCPTCFCYREDDEPTLDGQRSDHVRQWDSCFSDGHSYIHGIVIRAETRHRYRQWLTHKLGSWHHQFGRSGCVGCGRCITWCPVGIDITEEAEALCAGECAWR
jgi:sulfhydrogenase subunit beta (sulfur reductase)